MHEYACAILADGPRLLLGLRAAHRRAYAGCWDVLGGKVESGETVAAALARELGEEIGVAPTQFRLATVLHDANERGAARYHMHVVTAWTGTPAVRNHEHDRIAWFTAAEAAALPNLALPEYRALFPKLGLA